MLKNNVSFMISEFKNLVLSDVQNDMRIYCQKNNKKRAKIINLITIINRLEFN